MSRFLDSETRSRIYSKLHALFVIMGHDHNVPCPSVILGLDVHTWLQSNTNHLGLPKRQSLSQFTPALSQLNLEIPILHLQNLSLNEASEESCIQPME